MAPTKANRKIKATEPFVQGEMKKLHEFNPVYAQGVCYECLGSEMGTVQQKRAMLWSIKN